MCFFRDVYIGFFLGFIIFLWVGIIIIFIFIEEEIGFKRNGIVKKLVKLNVIGWSVDVYDYLFLLDLRWMNIGKVRVMWLGYIRKRERVLFSDCFDWWLEVVEFFCNYVVFKI